MTSEVEPHSDRKTIFDLIINGGGFAVAAVTGLLLSVLVLLGWDAAGLGVFSQAFAVHIVATQLGVLGQQNAILNSVSLSKTDLPRLRSGLRISIQIAIISAAVFSVVIWFAAPYIGAALDSEPVGQALRFTALSVLFGSLVKLVTAILTGREQMKALAFIQGFRPSLILILIALFWLIGRPVEELMLAVAIAEGTSLLVGAALALSGLRNSESAAMQDSGLRVGFTDQFFFGLKSMPSGVIGELNTRVDILVLGLFASDQIVGIYAFAAMLAEGFYLLGVVIRLVFSSRIVRMLDDDNAEPFYRFFRLWRKRVYLGAVGVFILSVALFPATVWVLQLQPEMMQGWIVYAILAAGVVIASGYIPFSTLLMLGGYPGRHTLYFCGIVLINLIGNLILTPWLGMTGTAIATGIAYASGTVMIIILSQRVLKLRLL